MHPVIHGACKASTVTNKCENLLLMSIDMLEDWSHEGDEHDTFCVVQMEMTTYSKRRQGCWYTNNNFL